VGSFPTEVGGFKPDFWKMKASSSVFEFQVGTATGDKNQIKVNIGGMTASDLNLTDSAAGSYSAEGKITVTSVATEADGGTSTMPSVVIEDATADDDAATIKFADLDGLDVDTAPSEHVI
jgi:hypothetical protein